MSADYLLQVFSLTGKTAILTGATGGLGTSLALALAKAGASIVSIEIPDDPNSDALKKTISEEAGSSVRNFTCDVAKTADLRACYASIWDAGIIPDILVNCAGVARQNACEDVTDDDMDLVISVNMKATYASCQEFGRKLLELNRPGKIINIASITASQASKFISVYAATKGAVVQMTKAFSNEWTSKGIQVNCISPGYMVTPMTTAYFEDEAVTSSLLGRVPAGRWGMPTDLEPAVLFLASPANTFTTGTSVTVDGGFCGN